MAASAFVAVPATADAAAAAASPTAVCGADGDSYSVVASSPVKFSSGTVAGTVYLLYSSGNGKNCVVTVKTSYTGTATFTTAQLIIQNGNTHVDQGNYTSYAGPVRGSAAGKCVKYWGSINRAGRTGRGQRRRRSHELGQLRLRTQKRCPAQDAPGIAVCLTAAF
ncbi:hypothetical protein ABZS93_20460 [Streptomyces sp900116325]|uniref:hypothetical protein n=1 Tax=Streptomyces sp. 900116325 TaxID=3154295 RepID=UPI0033BE7A10